MEKKKKLVIATDSFLPRRDGVVRFLTEIIPRLKSNYEITIIGPEMPGKFRKYQHAKVIRIPIMKILFGDINFTGFNYYLIKKELQDADLVFVQSIGPIGLSSIVAAKKLNKPIISYIHSIDWELATKGVKHLKRLVNPLVRLIARRLYNKCDHLIVPAEETMHILRQNNIRTKMAVVNLGVDTRKFIPSYDKKKSKQAVGINPDMLVLGFVSRISREKDIMTLYRAFRRLEKKYEKIKLLVVGKGIRELEDEFTSDRNIIMTGSVENVVPYLQAMDVFILPSLTETTSLATLEAMACGLPVISTKVGFVKRYIIENINGMFFPFKNSLVLSMKIKKLLENDIFKEGLRRNARETVKKRFNWENTGKGIKDVLELY